MKDTILLVEDEPEIADLTARTLCGLGYMLSGPAATGEEAIRAAKLAPPSLVLMDIGLPGPIDGVETARRLTQSHNVPVVFLTAANDKKTLDRAKETSPFGYIVKPFEPTNLYTAIEIALSQHQATERRLKEAHIQAEKKYRDLAVAAIFQAGSRGELLEANDALAKLLGYDSPQDLAATVKSVKQVFNLDIKDSQLLESAPAGHHVQIKNLKLSAYRKDGSTIWVSGNVRILRYAHGDIRLCEGKIGSAAI